EYVDSGRTKDLATYAKNLNLSIQRSCPPPYTTAYGSRIAYVTSDDKDCLKTLDFHPIQSVFNELWNDVIPTSNGDIPTLQCVGTVRASTIGIGADIGGNDAGAYADEDISGYQRIGYDPFSKTFSIQTGDILIWAHHIGIAVYVYPDKSVDLAESNIYFSGNDNRPPINGGVWIRAHTPYDTIVSGLRGLQRKE
ncbi:MAG: hypothetical protein KGL95_03670, partial [Patescibacteria group bacterium]|nr:hypothetical protein [Patescibacteria group bacterium]